MMSEFRDFYTMAILTLVFIISLLDSCDSMPEKVYGKKGSFYLFVCPYKMVTDKLVVWSFTNKTGSDIPVSDGDYITPTNPAKDRVFIVGDLAAGEYNLNLTALQDSDEGVYKCTVGLQFKNYSLELLAAPSSFALQDVATGNKILGTEGKTLTLRCTAVGGKPPPLVTITVDNVGRSSAEQSVEYTTPTLQRQHDKQSVQCNVNSSALNLPLVTTATLYLNLKPSQPIFSQDPISIDESNLLEVSCTSTGSRPNATFQWTLGQADITSSSSLQTTNTGDDIYTVISTLRLHMNRTYNGQSINCTASNIVASNGNSRILDVKFAPNITVASVNYDQNTATRTITCNPDGNPTNYTYYRWQHKSTYGVLIRELAGVKFLTLPSVPLEARYQDSGEYVCIAGNGIIGNDGKTEQSGSGYVIINANPVFTSGNNPTEYGEFRKDVDIHVYVYSVPKYTLVRWSKRSTTITNGDKYILSDSVATVNDTFHNTTVMLTGYRFTLTIKNLVDSDFNVNYSLFLSNDVGQAVYTTLMVSASGPETPVNFTISSSSQSSISVQWIPGYNGGHEQTFYLQYRVYGNSIWEESAKIVDVKQTIQTYTLHGLQDGTLYELKMLAENKVNKSSPTQTERIETLKDTSSQPSTMGPIIGGVAGGLVAVLIIIVIIWFMIFRRKQDTSTTSKATRSDSDVPDGLQHNILYQSAGSDFKPLVPKAESGKKDKKPSTSETEYAEVQKPNSVYAAVDKTQQKNVQEKKQKDKKKRPKKPGKKADKAGNNNQDSEYANDGMSLKDMSEGEYANAEDRNGPSTSHKNPQGLEYADLSFTKQIQQKGKKPVIHGKEDRTLYSEVDHSKKAPPPPQESAYEETNFKHG